MRNLVLLLVFVLTITDIKGQIVNFNMANSTQTVPCGGTFNFYDSGGSGGNYANSQSFAATFVPSTPGQCLRITFSSFATESCCDFLQIYDGNGPGGIWLGSWSGSTLPPTLSASSGSFYITWSSDGSVIGAGWAAVIQCTACPPPPPYYVQSAGTQTVSCPPTYTLFYDSGGPSSNYNNNENSMKTFSAPAGSCLTFNFTAFNTESCCDFLRIYNGPNGGAPLIGTYSGLTSPGSITSSGSTLTFSFTSDGSVIAPGWTANISCGGSCSGTPPGGTASAVPSSSCGTFTTALSVSGSTTGCGLTYTWQSAAAMGGPYSNIGGANTAGYTATVSSTTYFRRITACGANSATSAVATTSISAPTISCSLSTYNAAAISYSFDSFVGTILPTTDDVLFNALSTFGFPFCFAGQQFSGGYVASNSSFVFDAFPCNPNIQGSPGVNASAGAWTGWSIASAAPNNTDYTPRNAILGPWHDINPSVGGTMRMATLGTSPNRRYVISYENVPMFSCTTMSFTGQIKLFETSNNIEIHIGDKPLCSTWNSGQGILGLHNYNGTIYRPPVNMTAHNAPTQWTMSNAAYRWTTSCSGASNCAVPLPVNFKALYGQQIDGINNLWWETSAEENITDFIIERSDDANNFYEIGVQASEGKPSLYLFKDDSYKRGYVNYYRVTALERDGTRSQTSVYPIFNTDDKMLVSAIYPNPATDHLKIQVVGRGAKYECQVNIYDQFGKLVKSSAQNVRFGANNFEIDINDLPAGIYVAEIITPDLAPISRQKFSKM